MQVIDSAAELARLLVARQARLIAVDGAHGSGKSTLSKTIACEIGASLIEIDHYLKRHQGAYLDYLDYAALADEVDQRAPCILEGICMRQVADAIGAEPDVFVYVKRMARWGWADEDELVFDGPVDVHLERLRNEAAQLSDEGDKATLGLWEEVVRYHARYRPHETCDFVFLRDDA